MLTGFKKLTFVGSICLVLFTCLTMLSENAFAAPLPTTGDSSLPQWPMAQHDPQRTGKGTAAGPSSAPTVKWSLAGTTFVAGTAIGSDGTIYAAGSDGKAYAINPDGSIKFTYNNVGVCCVPPAIGADGTIYFSGSQLFALNPDFTLKWSYGNGGACCGALMIGADGTIYVVNGALHAVNPINGMAKWVFWATDSTALQSSPAISLDGFSIYVATSKTIYALFPDSGNIQWQYSIDNIALTAPVVGPDGRIYIPSTNSVLVLNGDMLIRQIYLPAGKQISALAFDATNLNGTLIASVYPYDTTAMTWGRAGEINAIDPDAPTPGNAIRWVQPVQGRGGDTPIPDAKPIIDSSGVIYFSTNVYDQTGNSVTGAHLYAFTATGSPLFDYYIPTTLFLSDTRILTIDNSGTLYALAGGNVNAMVSSSPQSGHSLDLTFAGNGSGTVTLSYIGGSYNISSHYISLFAEDTTVRLTATANSGSTFSGWTGCDQVSGNTCTLAMNSPKNITVNLQQPNGGWNIHDVNQSDTSWIDWPSAQHGPVATGSYLQVDGTIYYVYQANSLFWNGPGFYSVKLQQCDQSSRQPLIGFSICGETCNFDDTFNWVCTPLTCMTPLLADMSGRTGAPIVSTTTPTTTAYPAGGNYSSQQTVTLTANEPATIYYTTNGVDPTTASPVYGEALNITATTTLKFFAQGITGLTETVKTEAYTITVTPGSLWGWGRNSEGQLGDGTYLDRSLPVQALMSNAVSIAVGPGNSLALDASGTVWSWGNNYSGGLGDGTNINRNVPAPILGNIASISYGNYAIDKQSGLWRWGAYYCGGNVVPSNSPTLLSQLGQVIAVAGENPATDILVVKPDGLVWRYNLCNNTLEQVSGINEVRTISSFGGHSVAVKANGTVLTWETLDPYGSTPTYTTPAEVAGLYGITAVVTGSNSSYALRNDGTVWTWGSGQSTPSQVQDLTDVISIKICCDTLMALRTDGTVWEWGYFYDAANSYYLNVPRQVTGLSGVTAIAADMDFKLALKGQISLQSISVTPTTVNFGDVPLNSSATTQITISNNGSADLAISAIFLLDYSSSTPMFSSFPGSCQGYSPTLTAGASCTMYVSFTAYDGGQQHATLQINSNDPATPTLSIPLTGGVDSKAEQAVDFPAIPAKTYGDSAFTLNASANSGLPVSYTSSNSAVATINGNTVTIVGAGSTTITASQGGDANTNPATPVLQSLTIDKATPTIAWANPSAIAHDTALGATQLNATSGIPGSFSYNPAVGTLLNVGAAQTLSVDFTPTDTTNYNSASKIVTIDVRAVLTVALAGTGSGVVHSSPAPDINCASGSCVQSFNNVTVVTLTPAATGSSQFVSWTGCDFVNGSVCTVTMDGVKEVVAQFIGTTAKPAGSLWVRTTTTVATNPVVWSASPSTGVTYELEEATDSGFTTGVRLVYSGAEITTNVTVPANDTYYYRVRAVASGLLPSGWVNSPANAVSVKTVKPAGSLWVRTATTVATNPVVWNASPTAGVTYEVDEATDALFTQNLHQVYSGTALTTSVTVSANGTYYYRVRAVAAGLLPSDWVNSLESAVSVKTAKPAGSFWVRTATTLATNPVVWNASPTAGVTYEVEEATDALFTQNLRQVFSGTALTTNVTVSANGTYYYRVRANAPGLLPSDWVNSLASVVSVKTAKPAGSLWVRTTTTLATNPVVWNASPTAGVTYVVEEATDALFTLNLRQVYAGAGTPHPTKPGSFSQNVTVSANGTYYYRVRAVAPGLLQSDWVNSLASLVTMP